MDNNDSDANADDNADDDEDANEDEDAYHIFKYTTSLVNKDKYCN